MNSGTSYRSHQPFPSAYPSVLSDNISGMISPAESRRTSDEAEPPQRQSLPSIQEVISGTKPPSYTSPISSSAPSAPSLPRPFPTSAPRPFAHASPEKHASPRTLHPTPSFPPRPELAPGFSDPPRASLSRPPPPPPPPPSQPPSLYSSQQPSPPVKLEHLEAEHQRQQAEAHHQLQHQHQHQHQHQQHQHQQHQHQQHLQHQHQHQQHVQHQHVQHPPPHQPNPHEHGGAYPHQPSHPPPALYPQTGQLPYGQRPLPGYPASPRQPGPSLSSPFDSQRQPIYDHEDFSGRGNKYETAVNRAFEAWSYGDALHRISGSARTVFSWADAFNAAAREQQGAQPIPSRLPTEDEVTNMLDNVYLVQKCLEDVRIMVQQSRMDERARDAVPRKGFEEEDPTMYGDSLKPNFGMAEVKKRRGRAAPPGRCHSCNRIDTPEWRRGPDGARTLCNACGLHYAKLERKRQLEQRSIRPKPSDERN